MTPSEMISWFIIIVIADFCAAGAMAVIDHFYRKWRKRREQLVICEICQKPRKLRYTQDKQKKACRTCRKLYHASIKESALNGGI
jgi:hypothetical protein